LRRARALALVLAAGCAPPASPGPATDAARERSGPEPAPVEAGRIDPPERYRQGLDVLRYEVELALPDTAGWMLARARLTVRWEQAPPDTLVLDLTGLHVDGVQVGGLPGDDAGDRGERAPAGFRLEGDRLLVALPPGIAAGDTVAVDVRYHGVPDDGLILGPNVHGHPSAFADNWPNRARFWLPTIDHPSDKARVAFTVHAPARMQVVANGALLRETATAEGTPVPDVAPRRTWRWETRTPIPTYTMVVGAAEMVARPVGLAACGKAPASPRPDGCVEITWWAFPSDTVHAERSFRRAARMTDFFTDYVGPFPYEKLANVQSATRFGGMENASAIFYSQDAIAAGQEIEGTVSHEVAHQWFGDAVTERDWHHLWLSEGFASYFGALFFEEADGREEFRRRMDGYRRTWMESDVTGRPVVDPDAPDLFSLLNANNYQKGAWVLHMLRGLVGEEAFRATVREYYRRHLHGTALTDDLRRVAEEVSGMELGWFFEQWLFRPGYPVLSVERTWDAGRGTATVVIHQEQDPSWPRFRVPLELELLWDGGGRRERVEIDGPRSSFSFSVPSPLLSVVVDPDGRVLVDVMVGPRGEGGDA